MAVPHPLTVNNTPAGTIIAVVADLELPAVARDGDCIPVAAALCAELQRAGLAARVAVVSGTVTFMGVEALGWLHHVVCVDDLVIDATATQFDPTLPALIIETTDAYANLLGATTQATVHITGP